MFSKIAVLQFEYDRNDVIRLSQPIPAWGDVEMLAPDLSIRLGDTVVTTFPGVPAKQRVCGIRLHMGEGTGLTQTLTTRQLHP